MKLITGTNKALLAGLIIGISAALVQAYFDVQPPSANGFCAIGHPRDFINWSINHSFGLNLATNEGFKVYPALTVFGVFAGAYVAAYRNHEAHIRKGPVPGALNPAILGFLVANFGLLWGACPIRTSLLTAYGNYMAAIVLFSIVTGAILACIWVNKTTKGAINL